MIISKVLKGQKGYNHSITIEFNEDEKNIVKLKIRRAFGVPVREVLKGESCDYMVRICFNRFEFRTIQKKIKRIFNFDLSQ